MAKPLVRADASQSERTGAADGEIAHESRQFIQEYRDLSFVPGNRIMVIDGTGRETPALALRINDDLSLRVRYDTSTESDIRSGRSAFGSKCRSIVCFLLGLHNI